MGEQLILNDPFEVPYWDNLPKSSGVAMSRAAVLGAGTMGAQIAAHLANAGVFVDLLDLPTSSNSDANNIPPAVLAMDRLLNTRPAPLYLPSNLSRIRPGTFDNDIGRIADADWVIEAVVEKLKPKQEIWSRAAPYLRPDVIASTNTSGIPIVSIAKALPKELRSRFLGTHFFNPPRYIRLLEIIPTSDTDDNVKRDAKRFAEDVLGKGVVIARDVPNFIANRIGCFGLLEAIRAMEEFDLGPDEVDSVAGVAMGRSRSASFRTLDLIGLDVFLDVCGNMLDERDVPSHAGFDVPTVVRDLIFRNWLGEKTGMGFYKRQQVDTSKEVFALDLKSMDYRPRRSLIAESLSAVRKMSDPMARLGTLVESDDIAGKLTWRILASTLAYSAWQIGRAADDVISVDRALRWGFSWDIGPFEAWDALGVTATTRRIQNDGLKLPSWVEKMVDSNGSFYNPAGHTGAQSFGVNQSVTNGRKRVATSGHMPVAKWPGATIFDIDDGIAYLDFHSPKQAIGRDMLDAIAAASKLADKGFRGVMIGSHELPNFCVGANLVLILNAAESEDWEQIEDIIRSFQDGLTALKYAPIPIAVAPFGMALGGGAEIPLAADKVITLAESYIGLVEIGAGLIPAGGGCKEMLLRSLERVPGSNSYLAGYEDTLDSVPTYEDPKSAVAWIFETILSAKVSGSAQEARQLGFLRYSDVIVPNPDKLLPAAKAELIELIKHDYAPPKRANLPVFGVGVADELIATARNLVGAGSLTEHDLLIASKLASVLAGGDAVRGNTVDEQHFLDLEREALLSLCGEEKSIARIAHVLKTGKRLRN